MSWLSPTAMKIGTTLFPSLSQQKLSNEQLNKADINIGKEFYLGTHWRWSLTIYCLSRIEASPNFLHLFRHKLAFVSMVLEVAKSYTIPPLCIMQNKESEYFSNILFFLLFIGILSVSFTPKKWQVSLVFMTVSFTLVTVTAWVLGLYWIWLLNTSRPDIA